MVITQVLMIDPQLVDLLLPANWFAHPPDWGPPSVRSVSNPNMYHYDSKGNLPTLGVNNGGTSQKIKVKPPTMMGRSEDGHTSPNKTGNTGRALVK